MSIPTTMFLMRRHGPHETWSAEPHDEYVLVLEDIDELFTAMVSAASINPTFLGERHRLKPTLREWYGKNNVYQMASVFRTDPAETEWVDYDIAIIGERKRLHPTIRVAAHL